MPQPILPSPVDRLVAAVNAGDADGFLAFFGNDGLVDDWGSRYLGPTAIRKWSDKEFIGAKGTFTPISVDRKGREVNVVADWKSNYFSGRSRFVFVLDGDRIREMRIV